MPNNEYEFKYWKQQGVKRGISPYYRMISLWGIDVFDMVDKTVLDIGCGYHGGVLSVLPCDGLGVDVLAKQYRSLGSTAPIMQVSDETLPFRDNSFDAVFCANALDHMERPYRCIDEVKRVLCPGCNFYLQVHARRRHELNIGHPVSYTVNIIRKMMADFFCVWDAIYSFDLVDMAKYKMFVGVYRNVK